MGKIITGAAVDSFFKDRASGSVATRLMANGMNANALRTNDTLRKDEWKHLDETVVDIARRRLVGVNDLVSRGLVYNLGNGLGTTVLEYEDQSDMEAAQMNIDGATRGTNDRVEFNINYLPLPIVHKDFQISIRVLEASRKLGQPLDTTQAAIATRKVSEKIEEILFTGASDYTFGGGTIYGYTDYPNRNTVTLALNWDDSSSTGATILADVLAMKQASIDDNHHGPWILYVPTAYDAILDDDYSTSYPNVTIRDRIKQVAGIEDVKVADYLTANNVVLVEMTPETARIVSGLQPTTVEWQAEGGMIFHFKVMAIMVPQLRANQDGNCGIVHLSA
jgi:uncharacterized linocin/CFP29 family protein